MNFASNGINRNSGKNYHLENMKYYKNLIIAENIVGQKCGDGQFAHSYPFPHKTILQQTTLKLSSPKYRNSPY